MPVTEQFLLEGAAYALEQCGRLLRTANLAYEHRDYPTGLALASLMTSGCFAFMATVLSPSSYRSHRPWAST